MVYSPTPISGPLGWGWGGVGVGLGWKTAKKKQNP